MPDHGDIMHRSCGKWGSWLRQSHWQTLDKTCSKYFDTCTILLYIYKRPGRASQNSSLIISQCINSILDRTDLDLFLFFFAILFCIFSSVSDGALPSSSCVNSLVTGSDEVNVSESVPG